MKNKKEHIPYYVITVGPGVGKTTLLQVLKNKGMAVVPEITRDLIKEQQAMDGEALPWKNKKLYMDTMFQRSVESFETTLTEYSGTQPVFFDRGFLDSLCYAALEGIPVDQEMRTIAEITRYNNNVFILPPWKDIYQTDD